MSEREDKELQKYLSGDSELSRRYHALDKAEPAAHIDAKLLAAARAEATRPVRPAWMVPVALAATVVLGVGLSMHMIRPQDAAYAPRPETNRTAPVAAVEDYLEDTDTEHATGVSSTAPTELPARDEMVTAAPLQNILREQAADAGRVREKVLESQRDDLGQMMARAPATAMAPPPTAPPPTVPLDIAPPETPPPGTPPEPQPVVQAPRVAEMPDTAAGTGDEAEIVFADDAPGKLSRFAAAAPPQVTREDSLASLAVEEPAADPAADGIIEGYRGSALRKSDDDRPAAFRTDPASALEFIETIFESGDEERARELLVEFRKLYPDYVLPESFPLEDPLADDQKTPASPPTE